MILSVASGKGGTGKTTVAVNLALSLKNVQFLDCDVEEPNAHLFLKPVIQNIESAGIPVPVIDKTKCTFCGRCVKACEFHAIAVLKKEILIFVELCHGCGGCALACPAKAISEKKREIGILRKGISNNKMEFIDGVLNTGEAMPVPLIREVKKKISPGRITIIDVPPGTSCPVVESVKGSDFCILVTEPTPFGLNDLILAAETMKKIQIPCGVIINRADLGNDEVELYCKKNRIPVLMQIPFDREIAELYSNGIPLINVKNQYRKKFKELFENILNIMNKSNKPE